MRAIILSAGKGSRMYPLTANTPKCLIDIGYGKTVLESQFDALAKAGVTEVVVVAGYRIQQVRAKMAGYKSNLKLSILHNPFYNTSNNIVSLWLAERYFDGDFIVINGDDIFKPSVIEKLLTVEGDIVMTIDRKENYDSDDMLVYTHGNYAKQVGKDLDINVANGESIGIIKYTQRGGQILGSILDEYMLDEAKHQLFYLAVLQEIMDKGYPVNTAEVGPGDWAEIDFHPDVSDVRAKIDTFIQQVL